MGWLTLPYATTVLTSFQLDAMESSHPKFCSIRYGKMAHVSEIEEEYSQLQRGEGIKSCCVCVQYKEWFQCHCYYRLRLLRGDHQTHKCGKTGIIVGISSPINN